MVYFMTNIPSLKIPGVEHVCVVLRLKGVRLGLCVVYRPSYIGYTRLDEVFRALFVDLAVQVDSVVYLGDTNINLMSNTDHDAKYLRRLLKEYNTVQIINEPTRVTAASATLLDHIIVDKSVKVERTGVLDAPSITDHRGVKMTDHKLVYCNIMYNKEKHIAKMISYRDFSRFDITQAVTRMSGIEWEKAYQIDNVDQIENFITTNMTNIYNELAPIVCKKVTRKKAPWRNQEIAQLAKNKNKLRNKFWKSRDILLWNQYKVARNRLNTIIRNAKKAYFAEKLGSADNPKDFWSCLRRCDIVGKKKNTYIPEGLNINDINKFFIEMGSTNDIDLATKQFFQNNKVNRNVERFNFAAVTADVVKKEMNKIKSRAVGTDGLPIQLIKAVSPYALGAITHLVNRCLESGVFPKSWKTSIIHPLPKISVPTNVEQLRPISILPAMSKIIEKIVINQLTNHVEMVLPKLQSGFRRNHGTSTALTNLFSDLFEARDKGQISSVVMLDYSKAFDSINHDMLLAKMDFYGFGEGVIRWIKSYLDERQQVTRLGNTTSHPLFKLRGVPQGSCLGPILFNLYTSDFPKCVQHCSAHLYADDCQLHLAYEPEKIGSAINEINSDLQNVSKWSINNGLELNVGKCNVIHVAPQNLMQALGDSGAAVVLDGRELTVCDTVRTLGVVLDRGLTFSDHVTHASQRAIGRLRGLYRFRTLLPESAKLQLMQSLVLSVFYYCYPSYGNSISKGDADRIQKMQNAAIRYICNLRLSDHVSPFRDAINMLPMEAVCRILTCCMVHKALTVRQPQYLSEKLMFRGEVSQRSTRQDGKLHFPKVRLEVGRRGFSFFGPKIFNNLPLDIKNMVSTSGFKRKLQSFLKNNP